MYVHGDVARDQSVIKTDICIVFGCCAGRWDGSRQFGVSISNDDYVRVSLCCFWKKDTRYLLQQSRAAQTRGRAIVHVNGGP